jgi:5-(carboxyamino)imidazole ribonucleotide synthase
MRTVGVVGGGQLARMMAQAAIPLDIHLVLLAEHADDAAAQVLNDVIIGSPDDEAAMTRLAAASDVITFDHELVDVGILAALEAQGYRVAPTAATMTLAQNKRLQRTGLRDAGFPNPRFSICDDVESAFAFAREAGWPLVIKAAQGGYDGRGVWIVDNETALRDLFTDLIARGVPPLAEEMLSLEAEIAVLVARNWRGDTVVYPPVETIQRNGICNELRVPALADPRLLLEAETIARAIASHIGMIGIMAIEFFIADGRLLVNELAPRPHNSGHWSIDGARTSQFEQHLRAVLDLPLGDPALIAPEVCTVNVLGGEDGVDPRDVLRRGLEVPEARIHLYGKQPRPGRKLGHVTITGDKRDAIFELAKQTAQRLVAVTGEGERDV